MTQRLSREAFRARYGPWALVAGASEGFGAAWAREIAGAARRRRARVRGRPRGARGLSASTLELYGAKRAD